MHKCVALLMPCYVVMEYSINVTGPGGLRNGRLEPVYSVQYGVLKLDSHPCHQV
jgi:hypothetical protein